MRYLALLALALLSACDATEPTLPFVGSYDLVSVDGSPLPYRDDFTDTFGVVNERTLLKSDLSINESGRFVEIRLYSTPNRTYEVHLHGTWEQDGDRYVMSGPARATPESVTRTREGLECRFSYGRYAYRSAS